MIEGDVVDCMVALPVQLFYSTQIPACVWFLSRNKNPGAKWRDRRREVLFVDARKVGHLVDRTRRELSDTDIEKIAGTYHAWRGEPKAGQYKDILGFCKVATLEDIKANGYVLTPGRYVGTADTDSDAMPFQERFAALKSKLAEQAATSRVLDAAILRQLQGIE